MSTVVATAPGRVNLIGDYTDLVGGACLPMAMDRATVVRAERLGTEVRLVSDAEGEAARVPLAVGDPAIGHPEWARYVAGVVAELRPDVGLVGTVESTVPLGAGLSSSASLQVAVALALGFVGTPLELALLCQRAEHAASGVPCGVMDQLTIAAGIAGHALLLDTGTLAVAPVPLPGDVQVVAVHSGEARRLAGSPYAERHRQLETAAAITGPLLEATPAEVEAIADPVVRRRARHVTTEHRRVLEAAALLRSGDVDGVGALMFESHRSLRDDLEVSTPALDAIVERLATTPGVLGARLTGGGFGGCAVALCRRGAMVEAPGTWVLAPSGGAHVELEPS